MKILYLTLSQMVLAQTFEELMAQHGGIAKKTQLLYEHTFNESTSQQQKSVINGANV